ncbi:MAG TPA: HU family DNA-binding protein [Gammaproteobacteria bacterium]|nr:HU family DNA-binding protein [Gammaproteobacteria bacterium]
MAKAKATPAKAAGKPMTKSEIVRYLAEENDLTRAQAMGTVESLEKLIKRELGRRGPGVFNLAGLLKIRVATKPATKARKGVNPFTGEPMTIKAKPARKTVRVTALKKLKEMA